MANTCMCRWCGEIIIMVPEEKDTTWMTRSQGWNFHMKCWEDFQNPKVSRTDGQWLMLLFDIIKYTLKGSYNFQQIQTQFNTNIKKGLTGKGLYFTFYYFFVIKDNPWKPEFGIGILPLVYEESKEYWGAQEEKKKSIMDQVIKLNLENEKEARKIKVKTSKQKKKEIIEAPF